MKITMDFVTNSSSESFGTIIMDTALAVAIGIPFYATLLKNGTEGIESVTDEQVEFQTSNDPKDPEGTMVRANQDGSKTKKLPDGTVGTLYLDGTMHGVMSDGTVCTITPDNVSTTNYPDGSREIEFPDGKIEQVLSSGTKVHLNTDGTSKMVEPDGTTTYENKNGSSETHFADGDKNIFNEDGKCIKATRGNYTQLYKDDGGTSITGVGNDGVTLTAEFDSDGTGFMKTDDGVQVEFENNEVAGLEFKNDNTHMKVNKDGTGHFRFVEDDYETEADIDSDGNITYKDSNGTDLVVKNDQFVGTIVEEGLVVTIKANGDYTAISSQGTKEELVTNPNGTSYFEQVDKMGNKASIETTLDNKTVVKTVEGATCTYNEDQSLVVESEDGVVENYSSEEVNLALMGQR